MLLLDDGMTCEATARVPFVDDDTVRTWYQNFQENGIEGLANFGHEGGACRLTVERQDKPKVWIATTLPRTTREMDAWIARECGIEYQTRSGLIALLHRLDMEHRKPKANSRKLAPAKQTAFINEYEALMNRIEADEAVVFADAVHPTHAVRPVGCWGRKTFPSRSNRAAGETG
jgi:transposase